MDCLVVTGTSVTFIYSIVQLSLACETGVPTTHVFFEASGELLSKSYPQMLLSEFYPLYAFLSAAECTLYIIIVAVTITIITITILSSLSPSLLSLRSLSLLSATQSHLQLPLTRLPSQAHNLIFNLYQPVSVLGMLLMFVTFGKFLEAYAKGKTVSAITNLLNMQPSHVSLSHSDCYY